MWVTADAASPITPAELLDPLDADLGPVGLESYDFHSAQTLVAGFNWKRGVEAFLETYHFRWIHPAMKKYYFTPDVALIDEIGRHVRLVAPKRSVLDQRDAPAAERRLRPHATIAYNLFPATMLFLEKAHVSMLQFRPLAPARCELRLLHLTNPGMPDAAAKWDENITKFLEALDEDVVVLEASEHGIAAAGAAPEEVVFGRNEGGLQLFRDHLTDAMTRVPDATDE